ncbi:MAG: UDP-N-acetylglucosamine 2-epimerase, partial [Atribacterota bacterium]
VIPRNETEWVELVDSGWNVLTGLDKKKIVGSVSMIYENQVNNHWENFYGDGKASSKITNIIKDYLS